MVRRRAAVVIAAAVAFSAGTVTGADASVPHPVPDVIFFGVELYSGSGDTWTQIGGQTAGLAAGD